VTIEISITIIPYRLRLNLPYSSYSR